MNINDEINAEELETALNDIRDIAFKNSPYKENCKNDIAFKSGIDCSLNAIIELFNDEENENEPD